MVVNICRLKEIKLIDGSILVVGKDTIEAKLPVYSKEGDACMDMYPIYAEYDTERDRWVYHTGLVFAIGDTDNLKSVEEQAKAYKFTQTYMPNEMEIRPRSNLSKSDFYIPNSPCTLDYGYRGELLMVFKNRTDVRLVQSIDYLVDAVEKLSSRLGVKQEILSYLNASKSNLYKLKDSIKKPPYRCNGEDRCAQFLIRGSERIEWEEVETIEELGTTERGNNGFGSTGGGVE